MATMAEHDQATVSSPTDQYHSEKYPQQQGSTTGRKSTSGGIFGKIGRFPLLTWGLRALQLLSSAVALALASRSLNKFFSSERRMRFTSFVGSLSLLYLIVLGLLSFFKPAWVMAGPVWIMETLLAILWLCSFIAIASRYSGFSCRRQSSSSYGSSSGYGSSGSGGYGSGSGSGSSGSGYNYITYPQYGGSSHVTGCRSSKAAIAFAAFSFLLFALGSALLFFNVIRRLLVHKRQNSFFQTGSQSGIRLNKPALAFSRHYDPDAEYAGTGEPKYSGSQDVESGGYGDNQTYTNEQTNTTGGYNSGNYNTSTTNHGDGYGNTGYTGNTGVGDASYNKTTGNAGVEGSNLQYPEGTHQRTY